MAPILQRLDLSAETWVASVHHFGRWFKRDAGRSDSLAAKAARCGQQWLQGIGLSRTAF